MKNYPFDNLEAWRYSRMLVSDVYHILEHFPTFERYGLCDQIRRAVISVPSNIAEGSARIFPKEQLRFIDYSYGSLMEVYCQLILANDLNYISEEQLSNIKEKIFIIGKMINGMRRRQLKRTSEQPSPHYKIL